MAGRRRDIEEHRGTSQNDGRNMVGGRSDIEEHVEASLSKEMNMVKIRMGIKEKTRIYNLPEGYFNARGILKSTEGH